MMTTILWGDDGRPAVPTTFYGPDGRPVSLLGRMIVDTGADETSVPDRIRAQMKAKLIGRVKSRGAHGGPSTTNKYQGEMSFRVLDSGGNIKRVYCRVPFATTSADEGLLGNDQCTALHLNLILKEGERQGDHVQLPGPPKHPPRKFPAVDEKGRPTGETIPLPEPVEPIDPKNPGRGWKRVAYGPPSGCGQRSGGGVCAEASVAHTRPSSMQSDEEITPETPFHEVLRIQRAAGLIDDARVGDLLRQERIMRAFQDGPVESYPQYWTIACADRVWFGRSKLEVKLAAFFIFPGRGFVIHAPLLDATARKFLDSAIRQAADARPTRGEDTPLAPRRLWLPGGSLTAEEVVSGTGALPPGAHPVSQSDVIAAPVEPAGPCGVTLQSPEPHGVPGAQRV
jgi:hypothetical protein